MSAITSCGVVTAAECASTNAANMLGLARKGRLDPGCDADFLLLDPETFAIRETWVGGCRAWRAAASTATVTSGNAALQSLVQGQFFVGIDLGGTTISIGVVNDEGALRGEITSTNLGEDRSPAGIVACMGDLVRSAVHDVKLTLADINGFGICSPGLVDAAQGKVVSAANLDLHDIPLTSLLAQQLGVDLSVVALDNDANAALLGEVWAGAGRGKDNIVMLTLGTGIGGAIMCDGHLLRGNDFGAGELGHVILVPDGREHGSAGVRGSIITMKAGV